MTYGFGLTVLGILLLYSGYNGQSLIEVMRGITATDDQKKTPFDTALAVLAATADTVTPGNGGEGGALPERGERGVPRGMSTFDGKPVCKWIADELEWAREHGWKGTLTSGYRSAAEQARVCAETSGPCAKPGESNHQGRAYPGCAVDVTSPDELDRILDKKPLRRLKWTGRSIGDDVHFSSGLRNV